MRHIIIFWGADKQPLKFPFGKQDIPKYLCFALVIVIVLFLDKTWTILSNVIEIVIAK